MILPVWENTPWDSTAIKSHGNMSTLVHIPVRHIRFVSTHCQADASISAFSPAKWLVDFVIIFNKAGRAEAFINHGLIITIQAPAIQTTSRLTPAKTIIFLISPNKGQGTVPYTDRHPTRPDP